MASYVGLLRGTEGAQADLGPAELQQVLERYLAWSERVAAQGKLSGGAGLTTTGRVLRGTGGELTATDGPHLEATEIVGGYLVVLADDLDEAEKLFADHPHLEFGCIEVRKVGERGCRD